MPELCRFYGIIIYMYPQDHSPPHIHAKYSGEFAVIDIQKGEIIQGKLPRRAVRLIQDWVELYKTELIKNWEEALKENPKFVKIEPLE